MADFALEELINSGKSLVEACGLDGALHTQSSARRQRAGDQPPRVTVTKSKPTGLPLTPANPHGRQSARVRVCIATPDIAGPVRTGGIGTAYAMLAQALSAEGHEVTILYTGGEHCERDSLDRWVRHYRDRRITFVLLPASQPRLEAARELSASYDAYQWLKGRAFDIVHFPEMFGAGMCSVQAKRLGLAFRNTTLCVGLHSPTMWHLKENGQAVDRIEYLVLDAMERRSVACADVVVSPSRYLLDWVETDGWKLPADVYVQPYVAPRRAPLSTEAAPLDELVFFGRLETRKGLALFCDAVDVMIGRQWRLPSHITFLGKIGEVGGLSAAQYIRRRAGQWPIDVTIESDLDRDAALSLLSARHALAVMPSLADNTPNTVLECVAAHIDFVSTDVGGIAEMIDAGSHERVLVPPEPVPLADKLAGRLHRQPGEPVRLAIDGEVVRNGWLAWHQLQPTHRVSSGTSSATVRPLVSVCVATRNRPATLRQALDSLEKQTYPSKEIVLVDDHSDEPDALQFLEHLEASFEQKNWQIIRSSRRFPGGARNLAAAHAHGKYLLFMDDDNVALPTEIETLVKAAEFSGERVLTCGFAAFEGDRLAASEADFVFRWLPIGAAAPLGMLVNCFGDTNMLIRRETFLALGGFDEEPGAGLVEDWIFHSRAYLAGVEAVAVPEILFNYRVWPAGASHNKPPRENATRALEPYLARWDPSVALLARFTAGLFHKHEPSVAAKPAGLETDDRSETVFKTATPVLRLDARSTHRFDPLRHVSIAPGRSGIELIASTADPHLALPAFDPPSADSLIVRIDITSPAPTQLQMFWLGPSSASQGYSEDRSISVPLKAGRNEVFVTVPDRITGRLRLDPGMIAGTYLLHELEVRAVNATESNAGKSSDASGWAPRRLRRLFRTP